MPYHTEKDVKKSKPNSPKKKNNPHSSAVANGFGMRKGTGRLTKFQKDFMETHSKGHSKAHNDMMVKLMKEGMCPERAHTETMKKVGK